MTLADSMHSCPSRDDKWGGDIHDMHAVACAAERWHTAHDAGGLNALLSVSWRQVGRPEALEQAVSQKSTDQCNAATWSAQVTGSNSHIFQLTLVAGSAGPETRLDHVTAQVSGWAPDSFLLAALLLTGESGWHSFRARK